MTWCRAARRARAAINRAWAPEYGGFTDVDGDPTVPPDPSSYVVADQCPTQLFISSAPPDGTAAPFLTSGNWVFNAPAGTRVTRLETWRFGVRLRTAANDSDPNLDGDQGDPWRVFARDEGAQLIGGVFGESCTAPAGAIGCSFGSDTGVSAASRAVYDINAARIAYAVSCENAVRLPTHDYANTPVATVKVFGTRVTIDGHDRADAQGRRRRSSPPAGASPATRSPSTRPTTPGSERLGSTSPGRSRRSAGAVRLPPRRALPCAPQYDAASAGRHARRHPRRAHRGRGRIRQRDRRGAHDQRRRHAAARTDPARARPLDRAHADRIRLPASQQRRSRSGATRPSPTERSTSTFTNGQLRAKLDRGSASRIDMRVTVRDNAGNVTQGNPTRLTATSAKVGRRFRRVRSGRVKIPFGRRATLRGRLTLSAGQSLAGQTIVATSAVRKHGRRGDGSRHGRHRPPRPLLAQGPRRPEPHVPPRVRGLRRRARRRPRRLRARAGVEHDPRVADAPRRRPGPLLRPPAQPRPAHPRPRPRARPPGPRARQVAHVRGHAHEPQGPLARELPLQRPPGELPDPRPHPQAVGLSRSSSATRAG